MKRAFLCSLIVFVAYAVSMNAQDELSMPISPTPQEVNLDEQHYVPFVRIIVACEEKGADLWATTHLRKWYGNSAPAVKKGHFQGKPVGNEAYSVSIDDKQVKVEAATLQGVRYALYSLRQIAIPSRNTLTVKGWMVPKGTIVDEPALSFRGIHICWFHETEAWEVERLIRLAAYYKFNYAVIEPWGTFRSRVAPKMGWPDGTMTIEETKRLCALANDLGITLIPQINVFGHATQSRGGAGKHAVLDFSPEYQPLFEPMNGWNWCLSNPETRKMQKALITEMHNAFGRPPYFHIGCDEANQPTCPNCKSRPYGELFLEHLNAITEVVTSCGAKPMMWHDMLLDRNDERWHGFYANGNAELISAVPELPKDIVICDWFYGEKKDAYPTMDYFKSLGHMVLTCPWEDTGGTMAQVDYAKKHNINGMLGTLWHHYFGYSLINCLCYQANAAWTINPIVSTSTFYTHLRQVCWDMGITDSRRSGIFYHEIPVSPTLNN